MPAGASWGEYLRFMAAGLGSMFLGAQAVHLYYKPLDDMTHVINELKRVKQKQLESEQPPAEDDASFENVDNSDSIKNETVVADNAS